MSSHPSLYANIDNTEERSGSSRRTSRGNCCSRSSRSISSRISSSRSSGIVSACFSSRWTWNRIFMIFMDFRGTVHSLSVKGNEKQESFWEPFAQHHPTHDPIYSNIINIHQYQNLKWTWPRKWPSSAKVLELHIDEIDIARCSKPSASLHTLNSLIVLCWAHFWHRQRPTRWFSVILLAAYACGKHLAFYGFSR